MMKTNGSTRDSERDPGQNHPELVRQIGDRVDRIISDCLGSRNTQPITDPTSVRELRSLFDEPLPLQGTSHDDLLDFFAGQIIPHTVVSTSPGLDRQAGPDHDR